MHFALRLAFFGGILGLLIGSTTAADPAIKKLSFEQDVRPILKAYCLDCHGGEEKLSGQLDLRLRRFIVKGGESGAAIVPGDAAKSLLLQRVKSEEMPPGEKKLPPELIAILEQWIVSGAEAVRAEPEKLPPGVDITPEDRAFWSFQPLRRPEPPVLEALPDNVRSPIDAFVLARLREKGLRFAPDADRLTFIRRAAFDLTGLPPTQAEVAAFVNDPSPNATETLIDRLLESPHYGERWGRHWLDIAGYADSEGNGSVDSPRPHNFRFRDYVIRSLNADKPLDQFVIEQLAGDELVPRPWTNLTPEQIEKLAATGFLRQAVDGTATGEGDQALLSNQVVADTLKIVSTSLLGLTVGCAQCHDHKYDPISHSDYFRMRAIFEPALDPSHWRRSGQRVVSLYTDADRAKSAAIEAEAAILAKAHSEKTTKYVATAFDKVLEGFPEAQRPAMREAYQTPADKRTAEQKLLLSSNPKLNVSAGTLYQFNMAAADELKADQAKIDAKRAEKTVEGFVSVLDELPNVLPETRLFHRGDYREPKHAVKPGDLTILAPDGQRFEIADKHADGPTSGRRLAFARHLVSGQHPLLGRVLVNRIWLQHFGRGLVDSPGDFGRLGLRPTHPELLDWLATELPQRRWSLKSMHRLIMLSTTYRQSSTPRADQSASQPADPRRLDGENSLYWHFPVRRLEAEALRDRVLAVSGRLDRTQFGPPVAVVDDFVGQVIVKDETPRRSIYLEVLRTKPESFLTAFDAPVMTVNCEKRPSSAGAPQSLMLMNSEFVLRHSRDFAARVQKETPTDFARELTAPVAGRFSRTRTDWQYGFGEFDIATKRVAKFGLLPHFDGTTWGGTVRPDPAIGWALLWADGGHAGSDLQRSPIRRWTAPIDGVLTISGKLNHGSDSGDGVRGRIVSSRSGLAGEWSVKKSEAAANVSSLQVMAGDTIDFVTDCIGNVNADSFTWTADLKLQHPQHGERSWSSSADFHGPLTAQPSLPQQLAFAWQLAYQRPITAEELELAASFVIEHLATTKPTDPKLDPELIALTHVCQQLISSNEFLYVD